MREKEAKKKQEAEEKEKRKQEREKKKREKEQELKRKAEQKRHRCEEREKKKKQIEERKASQKAAAQVLRASRKRTRDAGASLVGNTSSSQPSRRPVRKKCSIDNDIYSDLCCVCFGSFDEDNGTGREWLQCVCTRWIHTDCISTNDTNKLCPIC